MRVTKRRRVCSWRISGNESAAGGCTWPGSQFQPSRRTQPLLRAAARLAPARPALMFSAALTAAVLTGVATPRPSGLRGWHDLCCSPARLRRGPGALDESGAADAGLLRSGLRRISGAQVPTGRLVVALGLAVVLPVFRHNPIIPCQAGIRAFRGKRVAAAIAL